MPGPARAWEGWGGEGPWAPARGAVCRGRVWAGRGAAEHERAGGQRRQRRGRRGERRGQHLGRGGAAALARPRPRPRTHARTHGRTTARTHARPAHPSLLAGPAHMADPGRARRISAGAGVAVPSYESAPRGQRARPSRRRACQSGPVGTVRWGGRCVGSKGGGRQPPRAVVTVWALLCGADVRAGSFVLVLWGCRCSTDCCSEQRRSYFQLARCIIGST
jgi:hypothetical protein